MILGLIIFIGTLAVVGGVFYFCRKKNPLSFEQYCSNCIDRATKEKESFADSVKTILVLAKFNEKEVAPFFYNRYEDGKVTKKRVHYKSYPFSQCPSSVQDSILKGEYIIHKF